MFLHLNISPHSNMTSFFRFVDKRAIYRWYNLIPTCAGEYDWLFHWQHKLCATFSANVNINYLLPIKVYYRICTLKTLYSPTLYCHTRVWGYKPLEKQAFLTMSTGPPAQDQYNFVRTSKFFSFKYLIRTSKFKFSSWELSKYY
jgi:hypothetical protein